MIARKRYYKIPDIQIEEQKLNPLTRDLYICELAEIIVQDAEWTSQGPLTNHLLVFCHKGESTIRIANDTVPFGQNQFCIVPEGFQFSVKVKKTSPAIFFLCHFNGSKSQLMGREFTVVRDTIPSVNNMVANRTMLFDEIFNNLEKGFFDNKLEYISFCFGHLLATFIYAHRTSEDIHEEQNPVIRRTIRFMEQNLDKKLSLKHIANDAGFSPTYLTTLFKRSTGYSPLSYFSHLKISKACDLLDFSPTKIKAIAFQLGYTDPYYFSKDFIKKMGISPKNYRNRLLQKPKMTNETQ